MLGGDVGVSVGTIVGVGIGEAGGVTVGLGEGVIELTVVLVADGVRVGEGVAVKGGGLS